MDELTTSRGRVTVADMTNALTPITQLRWNADARRFTGDASDVKFDSKGNVVLWNPNNQHILTMCPVYENYDEEGELCYIDYEPAVSGMHRVHLTLWND